MFARLSSRLFTLHTWERKPHGSARECAACGRIDDPLRGWSRHTHLHQHVCPGSAFASPGTLPAARAPSAAYTTRNGALDILKLILAFCVIGIHAHAFEDVDSLTAYVTSNGIFRAAVPIFLLINGYYFHAVLSTGHTARWFRRLGILYCVWMAIYLPLWWPEWTGSLKWAAIGMFLRVFFGYYHLWYLASMLGAAALLIYMSRRGTRAMVLTAAAAFSIGIFMQYAGNWHIAEHSRVVAFLNAEWSARNFLIMSFPFFCTGFLIKRYKIDERVTADTAARCAAVAIGLLMLESLWNYTTAPEGARFERLLTLAVACPAVFILFLKLDIPIASKSISQYSTAIYLVHILVIEAIARYLPLDPTMRTLATILGSLAAACLLVRLHRRWSFLL